MTKSETQRYLSNVYSEWVQVNRDVSEKGFSFFGYINDLDNFSQFSFGRNSPYQVTAMWVTEWNESLGL
ncbi:hypothetical protein I6H07_10820 [Hafnia alvei]|uniref:hypothetical protein n=1 Tax=Hafnia alvei TaxID=569 RepID=UPI000B7479AD|nr:hypothetical protein [Hafnia alvei]MBI0276291.1 hypothetical protein [Hafnia alvei]PNK97192.1 hypothetical protein CEQ28_006030 [Hafnia alvei]